MRVLLAFGDIISMEEADLIIPQNDLRADAGDESGVRHVFHESSQASRSEVVKRDRVNFRMYVVL